jgi:hypothetical protein
LSLDWVNNDGRSQSLVKDLEAGFGPRKEEKIEKRLLGIGFGGRSTDTM